MAEVMVKEQQSEDWLLVCKGLEAEEQVQAEVEQEVEGELEKGNEDDDVAEEGRVLGVIIIKEEPHV